MRKACLILAFVLAGCMSYQPGFDGGDDGCDGCDGIDDHDDAGDLDAGIDPDDKWDVMEAVYRWQFDNNVCGSAQSSYMLYLKYGWRDLPDEFMLRFEGHEPPVRNGSECGYDPEQGDMVIDPETGQVGLLFYIETVTLVSGGEAEVEGGCYRHNLNSSGNLYTLEKQEGEWVVVRDDLLWIS